MALTLETFRARVDDALLAQLTDHESGAAVNEGIVTLAVADAAGLIEGYLFQLPTESRPPESVLDPHQVALTLYVLAGARPGAEFDSIRARAEKTLKWLESLSSRVKQVVEVSQELGMVSDSPAPLYDEESLSQFGDLSVADSSDS